MLQGLGQIRGFSQRAPCGSNSCPPSIVSAPRPWQRPMASSGSPRVAMAAAGMNGSSNSSAVRTLDAKGQLHAGDADGDREGQTFTAMYDSSIADQAHNAGFTAQPQQLSQQQQQFGPVASAATPPEGSSSTAASSSDATTITGATTDTGAGADPAAHQRSPHSPSTSNRQGAESAALMSAAMLTATPTATPRKARAQGPALCVFSGGTAFNVVAGRLRHFTDRVAYILPVSDDGGSTAEIVRVLGGPAVGDIRSRCLRLADDSDTEARAVKTLLAHRLHPTDAQAAKMEWYSIVEGLHPLWDGVSEPYKHVIRAFLVHFHTAILKHSSYDFNFCNGSIGNFFFAGSRNFFQSLEAAIFLFSRVARIPEGSLVLPAICTEERITLGAELEDGTVLRGQNQISHPPQSGPSGSGGGATHVNKGSYDLLPSPIRRVFYLSSEGSGQEHEVAPKVNPRAVQELDKADAIIYGMGSLYTSICPIICLDGMGEVIATRDVPKVLCLNGSLDRETASSGAHDGAMTASDIVQAICDALNRRRNRKGQRLRHPPSAYVTGLLVPRGGSIRVDHQALALLGIRHVMEVDSFADPDGSGAALFEPAALVQAIEKMITVLNSGDSQETLTSLGVTI